MCVCVCVWNLNRGMKSMDRRIDRWLVNWLKIFGNLNVGSE